MPELDHPLVASLRDAGGLSPYFNMPVADPRDGEWTGAADLFLGDDARLGRLVAAYGREAWGSANNHVAGSAFIIAYLTRVVYPALGQYVLHRRVPDVSLENLAFHRTNSRIDATGLRRPAFAALPEDPAAGHPDALVVNDGAGLHRCLQDRLFAASSEAVIGALHRAARASIPVSRNAVAAACAQALHRLYPLAPYPERVVDTADALFEDPASPVCGQVIMEVMEHEGRRGFFGRRRGCCLVWRTPRAGSYCSNCILTPPGEQTRQFREALLQDGG